MVAKAGDLPHLWGDNYLYVCLCGGVRVHMTFYVFHLGEMCTGFDSKRWVSLLLLRSEDEDSVAQCQRRSHWF